MEHYHPRHVAGETVAAEHTGLCLIVLVDDEGFILSADGSAVRSLEALARGPLEGRMCRELFGEHHPLCRGLDEARQGRASVKGLLLDGAARRVRFAPRGPLRGAVAVALAEEEQPLPKGAGAENLVLRQLPGIVWATDSQLQLVSAAGRLNGSSPREIRHLVQAWLEEEGEPGEREGAVAAAHKRALRGASAQLELNRGGRCFEIHLEALPGDDEGVVGVAIDRTALKQEELRRRESEALLEQAESVAHVGTWTWDLRSHTFTWSKELHRICGVAPREEEDTFEAILSHVHPDDVALARGVLEDALRRAGPFAFDHRILRPDGAVRVLHTRGSVIVQDHEPARLAACCWDVTEQWETTRELEQSNSLLRATLDSTADGILVVDRAGGVRAFNERFLSLWRIPRELAERYRDQAMPARVATQVKDSDSFVAQVRRLCALPDAESFDVVELKDGRVYERFSRPQRLGDKIVGRVWSFRDVSERERLLRRAVFLSESSRLLASLDMEQALEGVGRLALSSFCTRVTIDLVCEERGSERLVALPPEVGGMPLQDLPPAVLAGQTVRSSTARGAEVFVPLRSRDNLLGAMRFSREPDAPFSEEEVEMLGDLAARAALAIENARLYARARDALGARDEFLSIAAHEIRGPLTSLRLAAQGLRNRELSPEKAARLVEMIEREERRITCFVNELMDVGRIQRHQMSFELEPVDLGEVTQETLSRLGDEATRRGSDLSFVALGNTVGEWDRRRLEQVVTNLLANAIKFGCGRPIEVRVGSEGKQAVLEVQDHGEGIPPDMLARIFSPFERVTSSRNQGGLGLGLYIVRSIAEGLGGEVTVASEPGEGSTFRVTLPKERELAAIGSVRST